MTKEQLLAQISTLVQRALADKGLQPVDIQPDTELLGASVGIDSLDLAAIVVQLSEVTGCDPFENGFVYFRTAGELVDLYRPAPTHAG